MSDGVLRSRTTPKRIKQGNREGVSVTYIKSRRTLVVSGWYDSMVGIEPFVIPLGVFMRELGITCKDVFREGIV